MNNNYNYYCKYVMLKRAKSGLSDFRRRETTRAVFIWYRYYISAPGRVRRALLNNTIVSLPRGEYAGATDWRIYRFDKKQYIYLFFFRISVRLFFFFFYSISVIVQFRHRVFWLTATTDVSHEPPRVYAAEMSRAFSILFFSPFLYVYNCAWRTPRYETYA